MTAPTPPPPTPPAPAENSSGSFLSRAWTKYRSWPTWVQVAAAVVLLFVLIRAASGGDDDDEDGQDVAAVETTTTAEDGDDEVTSTTAEATTTTSAPRTEPQNLVTMIEPPDEAGYIEAVRAREPERTAEFDQSVLVAFGLKACEFSDSYISGDSPNPGDLLLEEMVSSGIDAELADRMVTDIRNAKEGTLCDTTRTEVEVDG